MNEKLGKYLDGLFSQYEDETAIRELKEELKINLQERWNDLKQQGYDGMGNVSP
jgi:BTB/POZ domain-containing protein KCTD9